MMKRVVMALLSATMIVPAAAQAQDGHQWRGSHQEGGRPQPSQPQQQPTPQAQRQPVVGPNGWTGTHGPAHSWQNQPQAQAQPGSTDDGTRTDRGSGYRPSGDQGHWDHGSRPSYGGGSNTRPGYGSGYDRHDDQHDDRDRYQGRSSTYRSYNDFHDHYAGQSRFDDRSSWNRNWRSDSRYDWDRYRSSNRSVYRLPHYYAPRGWSGGYRRFTIGVRLSPVLWAQNYWISDPWAYRLPDAYGEYRWVRYYNDALLIDLRTGEVVDEVYDIFY